MTDRKMMIQMLNADMRDEHAAVIQYLQHAYALGEGAEACEIEAIARDEMRHFDWLAEKIVELGGEPDLTRGMVDLAGTGPVEWMERDVAAEDRAIAQYRAHLAAIDDPDVQRLLKRILLDEESHREKFIGLGEELRAEGAVQTGPLEARKPSGIPPHVVEILQAGVRHEYTVILQYLYHSFVTPHCEISRELEMQAINEMQHLGWLAEKAAEAGAHPDIEHTELKLEGDTAQMLEADIQAERAVTMDYTRQLDQVPDPELRSLLAQIRDHEIYHDELFSAMLDELKEEQQPQKEERPSGKPTFTVGSLIEDAARRTDEEHF